MAHYYLMFHYNLAFYYNLLTIYKDCTDKMVFNVINYMFFYLFVIEVKAVQIPFILYIT
jgi:hypothetical protein